MNQDPKTMDKNMGPFLEVYLKKIVQDLIKMDLGMSTKTLKNQHYPKGFWICLCGY